MILVRREELDSSEKTSNVEENVVLETTTNKVEDGETEADGSSSEKVPEAGGKSCGVTSTLSNIFSALMSALNRVRQFTVFCVISN